MRHLLLALCSLLLVHTARAQFEIRLDPTNVLDPRFAGASVNAIPTSGVDTGKVLTANITVNNGGSGYTSAPTVVVGPPTSGTTATATATITAGVVTGITITSGGSGYSNTSRPFIRIAPPASVVAGFTTAPTNAGWSSTSASSAAYRAPPVAPDGTPLADPLANVEPPIARYNPNSLDKKTNWPPSATATASITLIVSTFGDSFGSTPTLYFLGDEIPQPTLDWNNIPLDVTGYWRSNPVEPGETFSAITAGASALLPAAGTATITQSSTSSTKVTVASAPSNLTTGATLLGQRVNFVSGTSITLAGNANETIAGSKVVTFAPYQPYYYSPHANRVFATQAGRVVITWVSSAPDTSKPADGPTPTYKFRQESFVVSSVARKTTRTMYWTEKGFHGPLVSVPEGKIVRANPVYNTFVPGMTTEYVAVGSNPNGDAGNGEQRTLWYDKENGPASLHAYNVEGRILIEYLGKEKTGSTGLHEFLGADVVDIRRVADVETVPTYLGEKLKPRSGGAEEGDSQLIPAVQFNTAQVGSVPYGTFLRADGISDYYAERENLDPDLVTIYWLETNDAAIHFLASGSPGLSINWPKLKRNYTQLWPTPLSYFEPVNVADTGNSVATAMQFAATSLPQVIYQDDPDEQETTIDAESQRLLVDFTASTDKTNRSLLKFDSSAGPWYVRLFIQSQSLVVGPEVIDTDGSGPITGKLAVPYALNDLNGDGFPDNDLAVNVGTRLAPPSAAYELAGYITSGRCYSEAAYIDPFVNGVPAAGAGAIIPVNALSTDNSLSVWWFKKVRAPSSKFESFYVPAVKANYVVSYPDASYAVTRLVASSYAAGAVITFPNADFPSARVPIGNYVVTAAVSNATTVVVKQQVQPQELVIASTLGIQNPSLTSEQGSGSIYVQNDATKIGYNPNEEHALMLTGNAYALRSDLNLATSSQPYVLVQYNEAASGRPAMRIAKVLKDSVTYPLSYDKIAGTPAQPPMPLTALPIPLQKDGHTVRNIEVKLAPDIAVGADAPDDYDSFTFIDRKGMHWIYRGPHNGGSPTFGMKFYYSLQAGFYFPALALADQPKIGSVQPFVAADAGQPKDSGDAVTLTYYPKWPDDPTVPAAIRGDITVGTLEIGQTLTLPVTGLPQVRGQASAQVFYQQSIANNGSNNASVFLQDPTVAKKIRIDDPKVGLTALPGAILTSLYAGKTYFQLLPPHLQNRFYFDPTEGGAPGSLVLKGEFIDATVGLDYLNLNTLSNADIAALKGLCAGASPDDMAKWNKAIDNLTVKLETFKLNEAATAEATLTGDKVATAVELLYPGWGYKTPVTSLVAVTYAAGAVIKFPNSNFPSATLPSGDYIVNTAVTNAKSVFVNVPPNVTFSAPPAGGVRAEGKATLTAKGELASITVTKQGSGYLEAPIITVAGPPAGKSVDTALNRTVGIQELPDIRHPDTAVDSYALSTTGKDTGYVTLVFGNGKCFTDVGDPVVMKIIKVSPTLYPGDLKVLYASNPLDEQLTLRHSGDFAAKPENFEFQWRYGFPKDGINPQIAGITSTATASLGLSAASFTIVGGTTTYSVAPTVTITGGKGTGATATATLTAGKVSAITINAKGSGYSTAPTITFSGGTVSSPGTNPTGTGNATHFVVSNIAVTSPGSLYTSPPSVVISGGGVGVTDATAVAVCPAGAVTAITVLTPGSGYSSVPTVNLAAPPPQINFSSTFLKWIKPDGVLNNMVVVGGSPTAVISVPAVLMGDTFFTMTYRKVVAGQAADAGWSEWTEPVLVEGWIKRVLGKINPFNQRMANLYNSSVNTDVSLLTQAGKRWEGDIALNLENVNDAGLIEIYETVLNRGKSFTIGSGVDFDTANTALLLAAGYLSDLYTILGNEAYADAANPTISIDDQTTVTEVNTSRFSFEGQVSTSLDEELALLRGRDDFGLPKVTLAPAYNRLFWNYTKGINSGEVLYAVNYNIKEKTGSSTADGIVNAADAQRMFPQGHGDAYGHYLTAIKGYYKLLNHPYFTWKSQAESTEVLGQTVLVDYKDERKFAAAASNISHTAAQIVALVHRQSYNDDAASGWSHFRDGKFNPTTGVRRDQGLDEWESRAAQGNYLNWVVGNSMLPTVDTDPAHTGVQIIDRTTVPELNELVSTADTFQSGMDLANAHLNPLGLSPGAIAFDISPTELRAGNSHFDQVNTRALRAVLNAKGSFDQAAKMTRLLRNQENQISNQQDAIADQEKAYVKQLKEIYGAPYAGDVGPGKTYAQGYAGPDTERWSIIDRPTDLVDTTVPVTVSIRVPNQVRGFTGNAITDIVNSYNTIDTVAKSVTIIPNQFAQFATVLEPSGSLGSRPETGALQKALMNSYLAQIRLLEANQSLQILQKRFDREAAIYQSLLDSHVANITTQTTFSAQLKEAQRASSALANTAIALSAAADAIQKTADAASEGLPHVVGVASDATSVGRAAFKFAAAGGTKAITVLSLVARAGSAIVAAKIPGLTLEMELALRQIGFDQQELQAAYEFEKHYQELLSQHYQFAVLAADLQSANQNVTNLGTSGQRLLAERETFRQRAAAIITGYRTKDLTFRTFRNEALEQYRTLFDLAGRYTYLAAKSYDYETGLLGTPEGKAVINKIVSSRALGDLTGGVPQATVSTLGDSGLAGTMAQLNADFSVAKGRLGINNPDQYGTLFSMRHELYRLLDDPTKTDDDAAWQQTLEQAIVPNLMADPDVVKQCNNIKKPNGSAVPGLLIAFSTSIEHGKNFFGLSSAAGDHNYSPSSYATKISSVGLVFPGYVGMDPYAFGNPNAGGPNSTDPNALNATPYAYLIPCGTDYMLAPPLGDTNTIRSWDVHDQALPLPYNLGASAFNTTQFFSADGTLSEQPWMLRKHQAFRPVNTPAFFYSSIPAEFTNSRLVARSVWNSQWKLVIPAYTLLNNETDGINRFVRSVKDIQLFLRTYSHSGN